MVGVFGRWVLAFVWAGLAMLVSGAQAELCAPTDADLAALADRDFRRLPAEERALLDRLCLEESTVTVGGEGIGITTLRHETREADTLFVALHDDEQEATRALIWALWTFGGRGILVEVDERRYLRSACPPDYAECDPNRIFGRRGFSAYTDVFRKAFKNVPRIVSLHTNRPSGLFDLNTVLSTGICDAGDDPDIFVLTGEMQPGATMSCGRGELKTLTDRGLNAAYLLFDPVDDPEKSCRLGCDLQTYATRNLGKVYYNLEGERGDGVEKARRQLCAVLDPSGENYPCTPYIGETEKNFQPLVTDAAPLRAEGDR